jgi:uncharacterized membrane protein
MPKKRNISSDTLCRWLLIAAILLFSVYFTYDAFLRHDNLHSLRLDLGNMDQTVWNVLHGHGFTLTDPMGLSQISRLSIHADFTLILLAPFYLFWSNPKMLLIIQVIGLACGAIPLFWIARKVLKKSWIALVFAIAYLLYPTVQMNTLHDFHATSLTTTFLLFAFWYYIAERPVWFSIFAILAACGKEQFWLVTAFMGAAWIVKPKFRIFGVISTLFSLVIFYLLFWKFIPAVTPAKQHWALTYLSEYGGSLNDILHNIVFHPQLTFRSAFMSDRLYYYFQLLMPVGFISLASPIPLLLAMPNVAINVLSSSQFMRMIDYQYTSGITPWVFVSAIYGFSAIEKFLRNITVYKKYIQGILAVIIVISTLVCSYSWGELPYGIRSRFWFFHYASPEAPVIKQIAAIIPSKYSVSATNNIGAQFSQRQYLYTYPLNATKADYVVVELGDQYAWPSGDEQQRVLQLLLADDTYELIAHTGSFSALKRRDL